MPPAKPNDVWWREKFAQLQALAEPILGIEPEEIYKKAGAWPVLKLVWMRYALRIYLPIMVGTRQEGLFNRLHFIDLCAGSGLTSIPLGTGKAVVPGSAIIGALAQGFDHYHFVEPQKRAAAALRKRLAALMDESAFTVYDTPRAQAVEAIANRMRTESRAPHYLCFVDPEGFTEVSLPELQPFFRLPRGDFFFNFQHTGVKRAPRAAAAFFGRPELAAQFPGMSWEALIDLFKSTVARLGRPQQLWIPIEHGDNPYAYGMLYAAATTYGGNRWLLNFGTEVERRMEGVDGQRLGNILGGERTFDSLPAKDPQRRLLDF